MTNLITMIIVLMPLAGFIIGSSLFFKPSTAITIQKNFYAKINWRIEPISMAKELRNTKIMGLCLVILALLTSIYLIITLFSSY
ncbi:hypothetical protein D4R78_05020 [bacterium]|nr:MAG: hypothetical protein D4R78_05020 [bacterium]